MGRFGMVWDGGRLFVVDMAQRVDGRWIVIEINDAQESGYAGVPRLGLWQKIVELELGEESSILGEPRQLIHDSCVIPAVLKH